MFQMRDDDGQARTIMLAWTRQKSILKCAQELDINKKATDNSYIS
jgi:hypothetical protein